MKRERLIPLLLHTFTKIRSITSIFDEPSKKEEEEEEEAVVVYIC
jgi:hypothetical protein